MDERRDGVEGAVAASARVRRRMSRVVHRALRHHHVVDAWNVLRYGPKAPRVALRAWIAPAQCEQAVQERFKLGGPLTRAASGRVLGGDWDLDTREVRAMRKIRCCIAHWRDGLAWADTGIFEYMLRRIHRFGVADGCTTLDEVIGRYERLDRVFAVVARERRLRPRDEVRPGAFRESGGVYVHFSRDGRPLFGVGGFHRLAMGLALDLERIPVQVGVVHRAGVGRWRERLLAPP